MARNQGLQPPRGTRDFYPDELRLRSWLFGHFREVARRFAFEEVDAPIVEHADLFIRKAGEEIVEQLYHFELHGRHLALRPELTPSISRMVIARAGALRFPLRWYAIGQNWRYERMTRGRKREHYQWNVEVLGEPSVSAEAELIAAIFTLFDRVGLPTTAVRMRVNSRALLEETLRKGVLRDRPEAFEPLCVVIDKIDKIGAEAVTDLLTGEIGLSANEARTVVEGLAVRSLDEAAARVPDGSAAAAELRRLFELLDAYGVADRVAFDASVVRGLAYYTGVVFEAFDAGGTLRAVCGGGRYDGLIEQLGGPALPAAGFGFGDVVIQELLSDHGLLPELAREVEAVVFAVSEAERPAAVRTVRRLREAGRAAELVLGTPRLKRAMQDADRAGAREIWVIGPDEAARGVARVRDLESGEQRDEKLPDGRS
ncbi:MAG: histidine--tRNA ligase [Deltaproteobacteria bacterium]|nr:histidine--tRNA ligase [Deltaproteobacteria bacterium]